MRKLLKQQRGFTIVEALFQLFTLVMMTQLIVSHQIVMQSYTKTFYSDDVYWEMFVHEMQRYIDAYDVPFVVLYNEKLTRKVYDARLQKEVTEEFDVSIQSQSIRRIFNGGNEILLYNVKGIYASITGNVLMMRVLFSDGRTRERIWYVPTER